MGIFNVMVCRHSLWRSPTEILYIDSWSSRPPVSMAFHLISVTAVHQPGWLEAGSAGRRGGSHCKYKYFRRSCHSQHIIF